MCFKIPKILITKYRNILNLWEKQILFGEYKYRLILTLHLYKFIFYWLKGNDLINYIYIIPCKC
jgi:hypothetical protein